MSMSIQNRTVEFHQCVNTYEKINRKQQHQSNARIKPQAQDQPHKKSHFGQQASIIAKDISHVTELLSKLALLAKGSQYLMINPLRLVN